MPRSYFLKLLLRRFGSVVSGSGLLLVFRVVGELLAWHNDRSIGANDVSWLRKLELQVLLEMLDLLLVARIAFQVSAPEFVLVLLVVFGVLDQRLPARLLLLKVVAIIKDASSDGVEVDVLALFEAVEV